MSGCARVLSQLGKAVGLYTYMVIVHCGLVELYCGLGVVGAWVGHQLTVVWARLRLAVHGRA